MKSLSINMRYNNYDALRFIAMIAVIINHVSDNFILPVNKYGYLPYFWESISAFAVPAFLMISGVFIFDKVNMSISEFYLKFFRKVGIPAILFSLFYALWLFVRNMDNGMMITQNILVIVYKQTTGWSGNPLWYVYSLAGIYILIPFWVKLKTLYDKKTSQIMQMVVITWAFVSYFFEPINNSWGVQKVFCYFGFTILGNELSKCFGTKKDNKLGVCWIIIGFLIYILQGYLLYLHVCNGGEYYFKYLNSPVSPMAIVGNILIFVGFSLLEIKRNYNFTVKYSFYVYLWHRFVLDILLIIFGRVGLFNVVNEVLVIPILVVVTFIVSSFLAPITYKLIENIFKIQK